MDFKSALKFIGKLLAILIPIATFIIAGAACISYGKAIDVRILTIPGILCIVLGEGATGYCIYKLVKGGKL